MFPKADGQNGNPEDVPYIKRPERDRPTPFPAVKAIVIAKCDSLWPQMVSAVNEEHAIRRKLVREKDVTSPARDYSFSNCLAITNLTLHSAQKINHVILSAVSSLASSEFTESKAPYTRPAVGVLRLRGTFAPRSFLIAQDDKFNFIY